MAGETAIVLPRSDYRYTGIVPVSSTVPTALPGPSEPASGTAEILLPSEPGDASRLLRVIPLTNTPTATGFIVRVVSWSRAVTDSGAVSYWPTVLAHGTLALSTGATKPNAYVGIDLVYSFANVTIQRQVPAATVPLYYAPGSGSATTSDSVALVLDTMGGRWITLQFAASAGRMGALWAWA